MQATATEIDFESYNQKRYVKQDDMEKDKNAKKQVPLRISEKLYAELERWADDEFRSVNGQIEYLLTECVKYRKNGKKGLTGKVGEE